MRFAATVAAGLAALPAVLAVPAAGCTAKTVKVTEIIEKTVKQTVYKTQTSTVTGAGATVTITGAGATVTATVAGTCSATSVSSTSVVSTSVSTPLSSSPSSSLSSSSSSSVGFSMSTSFRTSHSTSFSTSHSTSHSTSFSTSHSSTKTSSSKSSSGVLSSSTKATTTTSSVAPTYPTTTITATATGTLGLNDWAKVAGKKYFGTAADIPGPEQQDPAYMAELNNVHDFGQLTPANYMKYFATEPERGVFNYTGGDVIINIAKQNGQLVRCHNLVWYNQLPNWLTSQTWDNATLISIMENHITNLVTHWGTSCYAWDVVNEALNDNGTLRSDIWLNTIGPAYLPIAFAAAAKAAPKGVKLYYNDYNIEYAGPKSTAAQNLVASIQAQGIQIDGVGLQSHWIIGETPSAADQEANMKAYTKLGVDVAVTELDVRAPSLPVTVAMQNQQKLDYYNTVSACVSVKRCVGITQWDFDDKYSWIPSTFAGQGYADMFLNAPTGDTLIRKEAYDGVLEALEQVAETAQS